MRVQKFRTIEQMATAPLLVPSGEGFDRFLRHCARFWAIAPRVYPRGVFKFRSIEEAQAARERVADDARGASPTPANPAQKPGRVGQ